MGLMEIESGIRPCRGANENCAQCETSLCGRESPGAGPLPGGLYGHWVGGGGQCPAVAPLLAGQSTATAGRKGAGRRAEAAARTGRTAGVFSCVFFRQGDLGAAMATSGPPATSTPGIGLVKFGLFAEDSLHENDQRPDGILLAFCASADLVDIFTNLW